jgi:hypothetical protein
MGRKSRFDHQSETFSQQIFLGVTINFVIEVPCASAADHQQPKHFPMPELTVYQTDDAGKMRLCPR